jgi:hypothetical protein
VRRHTAKSEDSLLFVRATEIVFARMLLAPLM